MSWAKLDDRFHENRKVKRVWRRCPSALGLHVMAITYCAGHETDGFVDVDFVEDRMPKDRERERAVTALVEAGLWHEVSDGWQINDFLEFNKSRDQNAHDRQAKRDAGRKGAAARWGEGTAKAPAIAPAMAGANGTAMADDAPDPTRPDPTSKKDSPGTADAGDRANGAGQGTGSLSGLADEIKGILERGIDGLTTDERCMPPTKRAIIEALVEHQPSPVDAKAVAIDVRSIAQSQNRAPNIAALYAQKLRQHASTARAAA